MILNKITKKGYLIVQVIVFGAIAVYLLGALTRWAVTDIKSSRQNSDKELAIQIAEAGIDYYRWHLAHAPTDFQDGTGENGPYIHNFTDKSGNIIGQFSLDITAPTIGSTLVIVKSTGYTNANPNLTRTIQVRLAKPSMAKYAVAANAAMRFGEGTEVFGPIHSNGGIRFDGLAHNIISSGIADYNDPDHLGDNEFGVHTHISPTDPLPPNAVPSRLDVFEVGRQFPLPNIDFAGITADLAEMKSSAQTNGFYRANSGHFGYHITLKTNGTFDLSDVTKVMDSCYSDSWSIKRESSVTNYALPANGLIFLEDNIWVNGQIDGARLNIIAATLPDSASTRKSITINNDLLYSNYDGSDVIGLIAQNNINVGQYSEDDLRIDAALIAQKGRVGRFYYSSGCTNYIRQTITLWGMLATNLRYGFAYVDGTGYQIRNLNYDSNLLYSPPPNFPLTSDQYVTLTWEEVK